MEAAIRIRDECFADDIPLEDAMSSWSEAALHAFFLSGGTDRPNDVAPSAAVDKASKPTDAFVDVSDSVAGASTVSATSEYAAFEPRFALGRGQFGVVYLMQHPDGRKAVDKRVPLAGLSADQRAQTFGEIELLRRLQHSFVVRYYDSWESDEPGDAKSGSGPTRTLHILMEYCDEGSLEEAISEQKTTFGRQPFATAKLRGWLLQLTSALSYVHSQRVIHRDLKTANILLTGRDGAVAKLGDFGISRLMSSQTNFASTAVGTPYYLSPELITSEGYDGRADVWSLGVILYELITFTRPFHGENIAQLAMAIARKQPKELPASTPQDLVELISRCLKKDKTTRPGAAELLHSEPMLTWARKQSESLQPNLGGGSSGAMPQSEPPGAAAATPLAATTDGPSALADTLASASLAETTLSAPTAPPADASAGRNSPALNFTRASVPSGLRQLFQWRTHSEQSSGGSASAPLWQSVDALMGQEVVAMRAGQHATAVVSAEGEIFSWRAAGSDTEAAFATTSRPTRLSAASSLHATDVCMGDEVMLILEREGQLWRWLAQSTAPALVSGLPADTRISAVGCGGEHSVACTADGRVFSWGCNEDGQLGLGDHEDRDHPCAVTLPEGETALAVSCAGEASFVLTASGDVLSCGSDNFRQLGLPPPRSRTAGESAAVDEDEEEEVETSTLQLMAMPKSVEHKLVQISSAKQHGAALTSDGRVVTWGHSEGGRLGRKRARGASDASYARPATVAIPVAGQNIVSVSAGGAHTIAVSTSGALWIWGQLGKDVCYSTPAQALGEKLGAGHFLRAHAGEWSTLAVCIAPPPPDESDF